MLTVRKTLFLLMVKESCNLKFDRILIKFSQMSIAISCMYICKYKIRTRVCVRAVRDSDSELSQVACGIHQEHSNIQSGIIYERLIHGVPQILLYKTTRVWRGSPLSCLSLSHAMMRYDELDRVAFRGSEKSGRI